MNLSICMAVRNGELTVETAIRSIRNQTVSDWELIVVDDGSADRTVDIVARIPDERIRLFRNSRSIGLAACLNRALSEVRGKFVGRMDADDVCFPDRFERQLGFLAQHPDVDLVGGQMLMFRGDWELMGVLNAPFNHDQITRTPSKSLPIFHSTWTGKADWFARYKYDEKYLRAQDFELLLRALPYSTYANLPDVVMGYRVESGNLAKRRLSRKYQRLAIAKNRTSLGSSSTRAIAMLMVKDTADIFLSLVGIEASRMRAVPVPSLVERWGHLVDSLR